MVEQSFSHNQVQALRQEQQLSPQQYQSLEILMVPLLELQQRISQEIAVNPLLEQDPDRNLELAGDPLSSSDYRESPTATSVDGDDYDDAESPNTDDFLEFSQLARDFSGMGNERADNQSVSELQERRDFMFNSLVEQPSLQDQLMMQLRLSVVNGQLFQVAELVIGSIDETGYLRSSLADIAMAAESELPIIEEALRLVQSFDPPGIGARDVKECLMLQLKRQKPLNKSLLNLVENYLEEIGKNHLPQIAKELKITIPELQTMIDELKKLNPFPGTVAVSEDHAEYVMPELSVEKDSDDNYSIVDNSNYVPRLRISQTYLDLLEDPQTSQETREYIRKNFLGAKGLLRSIEQRKNTIHRITEVIVDFQHGFFDKGVEALRPLTLQQVADRLDLHGATISRAIANKYMKTPWGVFEYKFFFSGGYRTDDGGDISARGVKEKIRELIDDEPPEKPLSDSKLEKMLRDAGMVSIARRTIAKYREEMGIPPSHLRKKYL
ncbi:MAG: RNA polymerase factor sigma-54 [Victivallaceae bacterium]|nr:RNA polymerase factor sigma-54 [Victivallaceae bacterium]MDD3702814.1 RNA polymerase factor sigma-54 [Victivallaceae bacterium]MDD5663333.1 RNA polymerase factor sigma-54 [Victivallaceae bacterium]